VPVKKISCSKVRQNYERYFEGTLPEVIDELIRQHLSGCEECKEHYKGWLLEKLHQKFGEKQFKP